MTTDVLQLEGELEARDSMTRSGAVSSCNDLLERRPNKSEYPGLTMRTSSHILGRMKTQTEYIDDPSRHYIMCKAPDDHIIKPHDSIDGPVMSHRGIVHAPSLACNVDGAVGQTAGSFNRAGRQVWRGEWLKVVNYKIVRE